MRSFVLTALAIPAPLAADPSTQIRAWWEWSRYLPLLLLMQSKRLRCVQRWATTKSKDARFPSAVSRTSITKAGSKIESC